MNTAESTRKQRCKASTRIAGTVIALAALAGCQTAQVKEAAIESNLPAATAPRPDPIGTVYHVVRNGEEIKSIKVGAEGSMHTFRTDKGCEWTEDVDRDPVFAPSVSWKDCNSTGAIEVTSKEGEMWPLNVGSSVRFKAEGTSTSSSSAWPADFECEAVDAVRLTLAAGTFDTYKVKCSTPWRVKTMYFAPSIGRVVKSIQYPKRNSNAARYDSELISVELPSSS